MPQYREKTKAFTFALPLWDGACHAGGLRSPSALVVNFQFQFSPCCHFSPMCTAALQSLQSNFRGTHSLMPHQMNIDQVRQATSWFWAAEDAVMWRSTSWSSSDSVAGRELCTEGTDCSKAHLPSLLLASVSVIPNDIPVAGITHWELIRTNGADRFVAVPGVRETSKEVE